MFTFLLENFDYAPRRVMGLLALVCASMLGFGLYLQHALGLEPCPMCIVQRYADTLVLFFAIVVALTSKRAVHLASTFLLLLPMIFKGSGDCSKVDWTFLGGSIANWSFLWFCFAALVALTLLVRQAKR